MLGDASWYGADFHAVATLFHRESPLNLRYRASPLLLGPQNCTRALSFDRPQEHSISSTLHEHDASVAEYRHRQVDVTEDARSLQPG